MFMVGPHLNFGSWMVTTPTSNSEGLKSIDRTVDRQDIAVCREGPSETEREIKHNIQSTPGEETTGNYRAGQ